MAEHCKDVHVQMNYAGRNTNGAKGVYQTWHYLGYWKKPELNHELKRAANDSQTLDTEETTDGNCSCSRMLTSGKYVENL